MQSIQEYFNKTQSWLNVTISDFSLDKKFKSLWPIFASIRLPLHVCLNHLTSSFVVSFTDKPNRNRVSTSQQRCKSDPVWAKWVFMPKSHQLLVKPARRATGVITDSDQHWSHQLHIRWHWHWFLYSLCFRAKLFKWQSNQLSKSSCLRDGRHIQHCGLAESKQQRDVHERD